MSFGLSAATWTAIGVGGGLGLQAINTFGGGGGQEGQAPGFAIAELPKYDFTEPRFRSMSDFVKNQFDSIGRGEAPEFFQRQLPTIRKGLDRGLENTYYGLPGQRTGVIPSTLQAAAITGAGSGVANRQTSRALQNYAQQAQRIDEFIAEQTVNVTQQTIRDAGQIGLGIPQGPPAQVVGLPGYAPQQGPSLAPFVGAIGESLPSLIDSFKNSSNTVNPNGALRGAIDNYGRNGLNRTLPAQDSFAKGTSAYTGISNPIALGNYGNVNPAFFSTTN